MQSRLLKVRKKITIDQEMTYYNTKNCSNFNDITLTVKV